MQTSRKPRILLALFIGMCVVFVYSYTSRLAERGAIERDIAELQAQIETGKQRQRKLIDELEYVSGPDYLDEIARNDLDLAHPGDRVVVIVPPPAVTLTPIVPGEVAPAAVRSRPQGLPIWQQWLSFFSEPQSNP